MNDMLLKNPEDESTRMFPTIGKGGVSQSMVNLSNETQIKVKKERKEKKLAKKTVKNEIIGEDHEKDVEKK